MTISSNLSRRSRRTRAAVAALAVPALLLTACGGGGGESGGDETAAEGGGDDLYLDGTLSMATGGTGGVYYPLGGGFTNVISQEVEGYTATVQETNGSVDNLLLIESGAAGIALAIGDVVSEAVDGVKNFDGAPIDICSLGNIYGNVMQTVTTQDSDIETVADMEGKVISVGAPGSATEVGAARILEAAGIDPEAGIDRRQLGVAETVAALRDGTIDAGFWSGGLPTGALVDLASTGDMKLIPNAEYADDLAAEYGDFYVASDIPADTYENQSEPVPSTVSPNIFVTKTEMPEELQYDIVKALFENKESLIQVHPAAKEMDPATADEVPFIDTCPGAQKYYDEVG